MPQPGKQVGRRRTMYADGGNIPQIDEESPLDIDAKVSFYNLSPAPTVISFACGRGYNSYSSSPSRSNNKRFGGASSALEHLYNATDGTNNFDKVVDFLGTMAEAELRVSRPTVSPHPPRNIPFPYRQRRRAQQSRRKRGPRPV
jgi:hypothetical protein